MRSIALWIATTVTACAASPPTHPVSSSAASVPSPVSSTAAIAPAAGPPPCTRDAECASPMKDERGVCEAGQCEVWARERLRAWSFAELPELASLPKPPTLADVPWLEGVAKTTLWIDAAELWTTGAPKACVPIAFTLHEGSLVASVPVKYGDNPSANGVWSYTLQLGAGAALLGPGWHEKTKDGEAGGGIGEYQRLGNHLIAPFDDALRYRGAHVGKRIVCDDRDLEPDPRCPRCVRCARYEAHDVSLAPHVGFGYGKKKPTLVEVDASQPPVCIACPSDDRRDRLGRFELGLAGVDTVVPLASGPAFFRTSKACSADRKARLAASTSG